MLEVSLKQVPQSTILFLTSIYPIYKQLLQSDSLKLNRWGRCQEAYAKMLIVLMLGLLL